MNGNKIENYEYVIDALSQGLIVTNTFGNVILMNKEAKKILCPNCDVIRGKPLILFLDNREIIEAVEKAENRKTNVFKDYETPNGKHYKVNIYSIENDVGNGLSNNHVCIVFDDVTKERILSKSKRDFFANASHELKSPLTSVMGYIQLVKEGIVTDPNEVDKILQRTIFEANRMNEIIIQMLDLSKLEVSVPKPFESISCKSVIDESCTMLQQLTRKKHIKIIRKNDDFNVFLMKEDALSLIKNIIENGIRYNSKDGEIYIVMNAKEKSLSIRDTGIGISKSAQDRIFERFYRVDKAKSRKMGGTGLGLSIVKHICINYKLNLELDSALGKGSTFKIYFN